MKRQSVAACQPSLLLPDQETHLGPAMREWLERFPSQTGYSKTTAFSEVESYHYTTTTRLSSPVQLSGPLPREARHLILSKGSAGSLGPTVTGPAGTPLFLLRLLH